MDNLDKYDELLNLITGEIEIEGKYYNLKDEFEKFFIKDNISAGIRIRKIMQKIRLKSKEVRKSIQQHKKTL
jgi:hypothetical protein